jgi:hypothetical protein
MFHQIRTNGGLCANRLLSPLATTALQEILHPPFLLIFRSEQMGAWMGVWKAALMEALTEAREGMDTTPTS